MDSLEKYSYKFVWMLKFSFYLSHFFRWPGYHMFSNSTTLSWLVRKHTSAISIDRVFTIHDDVIKWRHFPRYWPFVQGIHRPPVNSPHKGQWRGCLVFPLICSWIHGCANIREAGDSRRHHDHYDVTVIHGNNYNQLIRLFYSLLAQP